MLIRKQLLRFLNGLFPVMSLRTLHILFILFATALSFLFGLWALIRGLADASGLMVGVGLVALIFGMGLALYGIVFRRKTKDLV